ncbi:MAG: helix-turn-helix domain-containing protein, partial [Candidatus Tectomicrobia bacterium]|nr:helix-turn-helix domain-containing protein [Candidatus Tectomicrobia bacterium]
DKPRPGKPQALADSDKKLALTLKVKDPSLGCQAIADEIESEKAKKISHKTVERFLKFCGLLTFRGTGVKKTPHARKGKKTRKNL